MVRLSVHVVLGINMKHARPVLSHLSHIPGPLIRHFWNLELGPSITQKQRAILNSRQLWHKLHYPAQMLSVLALISTWMWLSGKYACLRYMRPWIQCLHSLLWLFYTHRIYLLAFWFFGATLPPPPSSLSGAQGSLLAVLGGAYGILRIKSGLTAYQASTLPTKLSL